jgi:two-component system NtrC family sensor kinase
MADDVSRVADSTELLSQWQALEKENRKLRKKLERSEANRKRLEESNEIATNLLQKVIRELEISKQTLEKRSVDLESTLSSLKATQSQLVKAEKMSALGVLVAGIAHEINNPVSFIYGNLAHLRLYVRDLLDLIQCYQTEYSQPTSAIKKKQVDIDLAFLMTDLPKIMGSMHIGAERIKAIVQSLRIFSRSDESDIKRVDIHTGLDSTLMILTTRLKATDRRPEIQVVREYSDLPLVECYAGQLNQVFMNLLSNAIDALDGHWQAQSIDHYYFQPRLYISTALGRTGWIRVVVGDNGGGIDPAHVEQIFDPFFTTKPVGKGTGLGLSISYEIVTERHRGQLICESVPGQGTKFTVEIPISLTNPKG